MKAQMSINGVEGDELQLGEVTQVRESIPLHSEHGRTSAAAVELEFRREMGRTYDDPADDVLFQLVAGKGRGEAIETTVKVVYLDPRTNNEVGKLVLQRACVHTYREDDVGPSVFQHVEIRAIESTYTPSGGAAAIDLDVLRDVPSRGKK